MKNKKGFTLIELLAVIVILAIIALIAVPIVLNMINQARKSAARSAALGYVDAIEYNNGFAESEIDGYTKITGQKSISEIDVKMKGKKPDSGTVTINENGKVTSATLCINGYTVTYDGDAHVGNKCSGDGGSNVPRPNSFATDSWATIAANTSSNKYHVGDLKNVSIDMDDDGTPEVYRLRIANTSTPSVCGTSGYSQTACGFVVEFYDVLEWHAMNTTNSNAGGWEAMPTRTYINTTIYNKLPSDLKSVIIVTNPIVSGQGYANGQSGAGTSPNTSDKLYLLSAREVGFDMQYDYKKDEITDTRTLDYYSANNNDSSRIKSLLTTQNSDWLLRTANGNHNQTFFTVDPEGSIFGLYSVTSPRGIAPAFRIGNTQ